MPTVTIIQPYVPQYRIPLFDLVVKRLAHRGVDCVIAAPQPSGVQAKRGDASQGATPQWLRSLTIRSVRVRGHWLRWYGSYKTWSASDAVVCELGSGCLDTVLALAFKRRRRVAVWGHVVSYDVESSLNDMIERWQMRRSDLVLAYTSRGGEVAKALVGSDRVKVLMNTVGTKDVAHARRSLTIDEIERFRVGLNVAPGRTLVAYIGGLDTTKRIDFLSAVLDELQSVDPNVVLLVGGEGVDKQLLNNAQERDQLRFLGFADSRTKALLGATCELLLMPGRVGLVAVESFVLGLPIVTVSGPFQAPEFEYLELGVDSLSTADCPQEYAAEVARLLRDPKRLAAMKSSAIAKSGWPSLEDMADRYVDGLLRMLEL